MFSIRRSFAEDYARPFVFPLFFLTYGDSHDHYTRIHLKSGLTFA